MSFEVSQSFALKKDKLDSLRSYQDHFLFPERNGKKAIYFCGNSLGLQPKKTKAYLDTELKNWAENGVEGHFNSDNPWVSYHELTKGSLSKLLGTKEHEVVSMNNLTTNLHLLLASFYQPKGKRTKILMEKGAFPSDHYAAESHIERLGLNPDEELITLEPKNGLLFKTEEIENAINDLNDSLALVLFPGVQYYSGQFFEMDKIAKAAHCNGAYAGFDLAHAIGNLPMHLHEEDIDFATWCSYKYLNTGPGGVSGLFIHEKHALQPNFPKLKGWWGHELATRFKMDNVFLPEVGVDAWMLSNMNILAMAAHKASLDIFDEAGIENLRRKSVELTGYLEYLLTSDPLLNEMTKIISPEEPKSRGCQLSIQVNGGKKIFDSLIRNGVILDWREPGIIRVAPTPLYNSFEDVWRFSQILKVIYDQEEI